jgi:hypothetical protein
MPDLREEIVKRFARETGNQGITAFACLKALSGLPGPQSIREQDEYQTVVAALTTVAMLGLPCVVQCVQAADVDVDAVPRMAGFVALALGADAPAVLELIEQLADKV